MAIFNDFVEASGGAPLPSAVPAALTEQRVVLVASVSRRTRDHARGFACSISGPAAPMRRLWLQSSAYHATGRPRASRLVCTFYFFHRRPRRADAQRDFPLRRRSRTRAAATNTPTARRAHARLHQGASAKEPVKIRQGRPENALRFRLGTRFLGVSRFGRSC